ncbi:hypothetical protein FA13DRAFT_1253039 [Coprinellus micaceus]|uniref:Uncharacterized protein n=1 Tax=Coprinellus micaceus TaxID=71717 RepID=A0A4Y7TQF7_COPMI|nr:hypothetical protein FA13DRAFT_1253039 [Coprinellus micaceus]
MIIGRHISSPKQFQFRPPYQAKDAANYEPPSVILAHPTLDYVFAFLPARNGFPGIGTIYQRGGTVDHWFPSGTLSFPPGAGIVGGRWLPNGREWAVDQVGIPYRLAPRGPQINLCDVSLLLVSEDCTIQLVLVRNWSDTLQVTTKCSLIHPFLSNQASATRRRPEPILTQKCIGASIGLNYLDSTVYVAFRSRSSPVPPVRSTPYDTSIADGDLLALPCDLDLPGTQTEVSISLVNISQREGSNPGNRRRSHSVYAR